jgi:hypothetical protein
MNSVSMGLFVRNSGYFPVHFVISRSDNLDEETDGQGISLVSTGEALEQGWGDAGELVGVCAMPQVTRFALAAVFRVLSSPTDAGHGQS